MRTFQDELKELEAWDTEETRKEDLEDAELSRELEALKRRS